MAKKENKTVYLCTECGSDFSKWSGKCPSCGEWNTLVEYTIKSGQDTDRGLKLRNRSSVGDKKATPLSQVSGESTPRIDLNDGELNRVLGGGLVRGSLVLIGGEPGIGKSTLILQSVVRNAELTTLYVSGEESPNQIRLRAERLVDADKAESTLLLSETIIENLLEVATSIGPDLIVIDSIQTMQTESSESAAGSTSQVRESTARLLSYSKEYNIPILIVGHITKDGHIAGPKIMEHLVDTVLLFEGDRNNQYRILRSIKNRFGNTDEIGIYEMRQDGLRQVTNPSEMLLSTNPERVDLSGICVGVTVEGQRPLLVEVQALVSSAVYNNPQRSATGIDLRRAHMLLAVLEKRAGFKLLQKDVFLNIAGGLFINDPALDLAILSSVLSSSLDISIPKSICVTGEVGLSGEVRAVSHIHKRINEAAKIGFHSIIVPKDSLKGLNLNNFPIKVIPVSRVEETFRMLFK